MTCADLLETPFNLPNQQSYLTMIKRTLLSITLASLLFSLTSCGPPLGYGDSRTRAVRGAVGGAVVGSLLTGGGRGLTRNAWAGAAIGGLLGAATAPRPQYYPRPAPPAYYGYGY